MVLSGLRGGRGNVSQLQHAVSRLPAATRRAMLAGLGANTIIAGAYTARGGGVCPMLAAYRSGERTEGTTFASAWDTFTGARWARPAAERDVARLAALLEESLQLEAPPAASLVRSATAANGNGAGPMAAPGASVGPNGHGPNGHGSNGHQPNGHGNGRVESPQTARR